MNTDTIGVPPLTYGQQSAGVSSEGNTGHNMNKDSSNVTIYGT
jgi:hypothetical protein